MSVIYYDQESEIKANQCKTTACKDISRVFEIEYSTYCILNRSELCECSLTAGNYLLSQTDTNCGDMPEARDNYFTTYYTFNKIILDVITVKVRYPGG